MKENNDSSCTDYTNLKKVGPNDVYPLRNIDRLEDRVVGHKVLSFLDAYLGYNKIPMADGDKLKTTLIMEETYYYEVMPFGIKNVGVTYQSFIDKGFHDLISKG